MALWSVLQRVRQAASAAVGLVVQRFSSGATGDLQQWQNEAGGNLFAVDSAGRFRGGVQVVQESASATALKIRRFSSGASGDLLSVVDENDGTFLATIQASGALVCSYIDLPRVNGNNAVEFRILNNSTATFQMWNDAGGFAHFKSDSARFEMPALQVNGTNSMSAVRVRGRKTTPGKPASGTWDTNDAIIDSDSNLLLNTAGGTPGTWTDPAGWKLAGSYKFASALVTSGAITIAAYDELMIQVRIVSMSATSDFPAFRFNADAGNNYRSRYVVINHASTLTLVNVANATQSLAHISGQADSKSRLITCFINNRLGTAKVGKPDGIFGTNSVTTQPFVEVAGGFEWVNTAAQITSVELRSSGGTVTFGVDSGMLIFGRNYT